MAVTNKSDKPRTISVFSYCELTTESNYEQDLVNLQYTQFITTTTFHGDHIIEHINQFCGVNADGENGRERFFGLAGSPVKSYTGRRERFLGQGRFSNPKGVVGWRPGQFPQLQWQPLRFAAHGADAPAGETKTIAFLLAQKGEKAARALLDSYANVADKVDGELKALVDYCTASSPA